MADIKKLIELEDLQPTRNLIEYKAKKFALLANSKITNSKLEFLHQMGLNPLEFLLPRSKGYYPFHRLIQVQFELFGLIIRIHEELDELNKDLSYAESTICAFALENKLTLNHVNFTDIYKLCFKESNYNEKYNIRIKNLSGKYGCILEDSRLDTLQLRVKEILAQSNYIGNQLEWGYHMSFMSKFIRGINSEKRQVLYILSEMKKEQFIGFKNNEDLNSDDWLVSKYTIYDYGNLAYATNLIETGELLRRDDDAFSAVFTDDDWPKSPMLLDGMETILLECKNAGDDAIIGYFWKMCIQSVFATIEKLIRNYLTVRAAFKKIKVNLKYEFNLYMFIACVSICALEAYKMRDEYSKEAWVLNSFIEFFITRCRFQYYTWKDFRSSGLMVKNDTFRLYTEMYKEEVEGFGSVRQEMFDAEFLSKLAIYKEKHEKFNRTDPSLLKDAHSALQKIEVLKNCEIFGNDKFMLLLISPDNSDDYIV